jgi:hypothetical protein
MELGIESASKFNSEKRKMPHLWKRQRFLILDLDGYLVKDPFPDQKSSD